MDIFGNPSLTLRARHLRNPAGKRQVFVLETFRRGDLLDDGRRRIREPAPEDPCLRAIQSIAGFDPGEVGAKESKSDHWRERRRTQNEAAAPETRGFDETANRQKIHRRIHVNLVDDQIRGGHAQQMGQVAAAPTVGELHHRIERRREHWRGDHPHLAIVEAAQRAQALAEIR